MSVEAITVVLHHSKARGAAKLVLLGIANHINPDNDGAWPSQATLAKYANTSDRAVRSAIDSLVALGELEVEVGGGQSSSQYKPNRYRLKLRCPDLCDGSIAHRRRVEVSDIRVEVSDVRVEVFDNQGGSRLPTNRNRTIKNQENKRATRLDPSKLPREELLKWAQENHPRVNGPLELECFIDYWTSRGSDATRTNWVATWRNWVRNTEKRLPATRVSTPKQTNLQRNLSVVELIARQEAARSVGEVEA